MHPSKSDRPFANWLLIGLGFLVGLSWSGDAPLAAEPIAGKMPAYPRRDVAITYQVDPHWPAARDGVPWESVSGVAVDAQDRIYVLVRARMPVRVYDQAGQLLRAWGDGALHTPHHLKIDSAGNIWVSDIGYHVVRKFSPSGELLTTLGTLGQPGNGPTHFDQPTDMAVDADGSVYVSDGYGNNRVVQFDPQGNFVRSWGKMGTAAGEFSLPHAIALDRNGRLYVADRNNARIQVFDRAGKLNDVIGDVIVPWGFCLTNQDDLWVCGCSPMGWRLKDEVLSCPPKDQIFIRFDRDGRVRQLWTVPKGDEGHHESGTLDWVHCLAADSQGNLYAGDIRGKRIQKFVRQQAAP
jgi:sugar lactone lactonase YvrE